MGKTKPAITACSANQCQRLAASGIAAAPEEGSRVGILLLPCVRKSETDGSIQYLSQRASAAHQAVSANITQRGLAPYARSLHAPHVIQATIAAPYCGEPASLSDNRRAWEANH